MKSPLHKATRHIRREKKCRDIFYMSLWNGLYASLCIGR